MVISAGLLIIHDNKILLVHPTNAPWYGTFSIPKGEVEEGEELITAAFREAEEELGIDIRKCENSICLEPQWVEYRKKSGGAPYKKVAYFVVWIYEELHPDIFKLQKEEVDWAGFLEKQEAEKRISPRLKEILNHLITK